MSELDLERYPMLQEMVRFIETKEPTRKMPYILKEVKAILDGVHLCYGLDAKVSLVEYRVLLYVTSAELRLYYLREEFLDRECFKDDSSKYDDEDMKILEEEEFKREFKSFKKETEISKLELNTIKALLVTTVFPIASLFLVILIIGIIVMVDGLAYTIMVIALAAVILGLFIGHVEKK